MLDVDLRKIVKGGIDLTDAINSEISEYKRLDDNLIVNFLKSIEIK